MTARKLTVTVDADAVFFPTKLVACISLPSISPTSGFLASCQGVEYGFFGNLEALTKTACSILLASVDTCKTKTVKDEKIGIHEIKYGPMGEDLFAEMCMRKNGVIGMEVFDLSKDGCCVA